MEEQLGDTTELLNQIIPETQIILNLSITGMNKSPLLFKQCDLDFLLLLAERKFHEQEDQNQPMNKRHKTKPSHKEQGKEIHQQNYYAK